MKSQVCPRQSNSDPCGFVTTSTPARPFSRRRVTTIYWYFYVIFYCFCGYNLFINIERGSFGTKDCDWCCSSWHLLLSLFETSKWIVLLALCSALSVQSGSFFATFPFVEANRAILLVVCGVFATFPILDTFELCYWLLLELSPSTELLSSYFPYLGFCIELEGPTAGINRALLPSLVAVYPFLLHLSSPSVYSSVYSSLFFCLFSYTLPPTTPSTLRLYSYLLYLYLAALLPLSSFSCCLDTSTFIFIFLPFSISAFILTLFSPGSGLIVCCFLFFLFKYYFPCCVPSIPFPAPVLLFCFLFCVLSSPVLPQFLAFRLPFFLVFYPMRSLPYALLTLCVPSFPRDFLFLRSQFPISYLSLPIPFLLPSSSPSLLLWYLFLKFSAFPAPYAFPFPMRSLPCDFLSLCVPSFHLWFLAFLAFSFHPIRFLSYPFSFLPSLLSYCPVFLLSCVAFLFSCIAAFLFFCVLLFVFFCSDPPKFDVFFCFPNLFQCFRLFHTLQHPSSQQVSCRTCLSLSS